MKNTICILLALILFYPQIVTTQAIDTEQRFVVTYQETNIRESIGTSSAKLARVTSGKE